jgi:hypothetical protein
VYSPLHLPLASLYNTAHTQRHFALVCAMGQEFQNGWLTT